MADWNELGDRVARFDKILSDGCARAVKEAVRAGEDTAKTSHRWQDRTGQASSEIHGQVDVATRGGATGSITAGPNATRLAEGTAAHVILPKAAKGLVGPLPMGQTRGRRSLRGQERSGVLAFQVSGHTVFARRVQHPGTEADPYLDNAAAVAEIVLEREMERAIAAAFEAL